MSNVTVFEKKNRRFRNRKQRSRLTRFVNYLTLIVFSVTVSTNEIVSRVRRSPDRRVDDEGVVFAEFLSTITRNRLRFAEAARRHFRDITTRKFSAL